MKHRLPIMAFAIFVIVTSLATFGFASGDSNTAARLARAMAVQEANTSTLMQVDGIVGTGVSLAQASPVIVIYTSSSAVSVPASLGGFPVETRAVGTVFALHHHPDHNKGGGGGGNGGGGGVDPTKRFDRPVPIGVSSGNEEDHALIVCTTGTYGARVKDGESNVYALSNNHVYAKENLASIGSAILQPGLADSNCEVKSEDKIANLWDFVPLQPAGNTVDAAIAISDTSLIGNSTPSDGYGTPKSLTSAAQVGISVQKYGRTTGQTSGTVSAVNVTIRVIYLTGPKVFEDQIEIKSNKRSEFSDSGDSGSLVINSTLNPVGLLFAGSTNGEFTFANPIDAVLEAFVVAIDGSS